MTDLASFLLKRKLAGVIILALAVISLAPRADAQVLYGSIVGTVQDSTGAVVPSAKVSIINKGYQPDSGSRHGFNRDVHVDQRAGRNL